MQPLHLSCKCHVSAVSYGCILTSGRVCLHLQEQLKLLAERKYELAAAEEAAKASPKEQREALMARVKRDNAAVERATSEAKQLQEEVRQLEAAVAAAGSAAAGGGMKSGGALLPPDTDEQGRRCGQQRGWVWQTCLMIDWLLVLQAVTATSVAFVGAARMSQQKA